MLAQRYQKKMLKCNKNNYKSFNISFLYRCANILDVYLSFLFVCTVSLTLVSDQTSRRFIRWQLFQTFIYISLTGFSDVVYIYMYHLHTLIHMSYAYP